MGYKVTNFIFFKSLKLPVGMDVSSYKGSKHSPNSTVMTCVTHNDPTKWNYVNDPHRIPYGHNI